MGEGEGVVLGGLVVASVWGGGWGGVWDTVAW